MVINLNNGNFSELLSKNKYKAMIIVPCAIWNGTLKNGTFGQKSILDSVRYIFRSSEYSPRCSASVSSENYFPILLTHGGTQRTEEQRNNTILPLYHNFGTFQIRTSNSTYGNDLMDILKQECFGKN